MSRDEFIKTTTDYNKRGSRFVIVFLLLAFVSLIGYLPFQKSFQAYLASRFSENISQALAAIPIVLPPLLFFGFAAVVAYKKEKKFKVACPHCSKNLAATIFLRGVVIASNNCPYCGMTVIHK
jgi:DNA-directed RNA polymerase subunit RPC12/RpoP